MSAANPTDDAVEDDAISTPEGEPTDAEATYSGPTCEKCDAPLAEREAVACRHCGWYASIGSYVEIDQSWEAASDPDLDPDGATVETTQVPRWAWVCIGCVVAVIVQSVAACVLTDAGSAARTSWSVTQLFAGAGGFALCHVLAFAVQMKGQNDINLSDILMRPLTTWAQVLHELPRRQWLCHVGFSGLTAVAMSIFVIGDVPYERLLDWGIEPERKEETKPELASRLSAKPSDEEKSLEEAARDFAGTPQEHQGRKKPKQPQAPPRGKTECVILGYQITDDGLIYGLLLGGAHRGKLVYVGKVTPNIPVEENRELADRLAQLEIRRPYVRVPVERARWVTPRFVCLVSYRRIGKQGGLYDSKLEELIGEVELKTEQQRPQQQPNEQPNEQETINSGGTPR